MCALFAQSKNSFCLGANGSEVAPAAQVQSFTNGDGTESSPYQITSFEDLQVLATNCNAGETYSGKYFKVMKNITIDNTNSSTNWVPIGIGKTDSTLNVFSGVFDGNNKDITIIGGLSHSFTFWYESYGSIFGSAVDATIKNLNVIFQTNSVSTFSFTTNDSSGWGGYYLGGIIGALYGGTIENCSISGDKITFSGVSSAYKFGGIMCLSTTSSGEQKETHIKNCKVLCDIEGSFYQAGGIAAGYVSTITDCFVKSNLVFSRGQKLGGIAGTNVGIIERCCVSGNLTFAASYSIGGIIGDATYSSSASTIKNCIVNGTIDFYSVGDPGNIGILVGCGGTIINCIANVNITRLVVLDGSIGAIGASNVTAYNCLIIGTASYGLINYSSTNNSTRDATNGLYSVVSDSNLKLVNTFKGTGTNGYTWNSSYPWDIGNSNSIWCIEDDKAMCPTLTNFPLDKVVVKITVNKNNTIRNDIIYLFDENNDILQQCVVNDGSVIKLEFAYNSSFKIFVYKTLYTNCTIDETLTNTKVVQVLSRNMNIEINITSVENINNWIMV